MTDRDLRFADEYMIDGNAKAAAIRAGYSPKTAKNASAWINELHPQKPKLRELIEKKQAELSRRTGVSAERIIRELSKIAFSDISDIVDLKTGVPLEDAQRMDTAALAGIRVRRTSQGDEYETRMCDKVRALELIGKHIGMFTENVQINASVPVIADDIAEADDGGN